MAALKDILLFLSDVCNRQRGVAGFLGTFPEHGPNLFPVSPPSPAADEIRQASDIAAGKAGLSADRAVRDDSGALPQPRRALFRPLLLRLFGLLFS